MHRIITATLLMALASCAAPQESSYDKTKLRVAESHITTLESDLESARHMIREQTKQIEALKSLRKESYSNDTIHQWATETVSKYWIGDPAGPYDLCYLHAVKDKQTGEPAESLYLDVGKYPDDVVNACALITHGQEW